MLALALGVLAVPCAEEDAPTLETDVAGDRYRYAWLDDAERRAERARLGLARALLLRAGIAHTENDAQALAIELKM